MSAAAPLESPLEGEVHIRPATEGDLPFIVDSWMRSYSKSVTVARPIYDRFQRELIERLLKASTVLVACNSESPSQLFGYVVAQRRGAVVVLHYVYVKQIFRHFGIAAALLSHVGAQGRCQYTHRTKKGESLARKLGAHFNPYLLPGDA